MRKRRRTEHLGFQATKEEEQMIRGYVKSRRMTVTEYFREVAVQPLLQAQAAEVGVPDAVD